MVGLDILEHREIYRLVKLVCEWAIQKAGITELKVASISTLYALMELFEISPSELFYYDITKYKEDEEILNLLKKMTKEDKLAVSHLLQNRK